MTNQEINEAVARKLGWKHAQCQDAPGLKTGKEWWFDLEGMPRDTPDFCHSIAAAWEIVEKFQYNLRRIKAMPANKESFWLYKFEICTGPFAEDWISESADTAPMAIALCFLKLEDSK